MTDYDSARLLETIQSVAVLTDSPKRYREALQKFRTYLDETNQSKGMWIIYEALLLRAADQHAVLAEIDTSAIH